MAFGTNTITVCKCSNDCCCSLGASKMSNADRQGLLIFPYNGNAREALDCLGPVDEFIAFVDDNPEKQGETPSGHKVMGREALEAFPRARVLAVQGGSQSYLRRGTILDSLAIEPRRFASVIHPAACISRDAKIGIGVLILAGVVITSNAIIGDHVCVLPNTVIHHDSTVGALTLIGAGVTVCGGTTIGENCYIGSGSTIIHGVRIGNRALVGLGSNVIGSVRSGAKFAGNPARQIGWA
jgi:sugar O-acyltransferase (sialic acid O-acetyltransferase NeuD family)